MIILAQGLGNALGAARKEIDPGMLRRRDVKAYQSQPTGRAGSSADPGVAGETLLALVITLDRRVREAMKEFNAVEERRDDWGSS